MAQTVFTPYPIPAHDAGEARLELAAAFKAAGFELRLDNARRLFTARRRGSNVVLFAAPRAWELADWLERQVAAEKTG